MKKYYYLNSAQQQMGPVYADEFPRLGLTGETFVWCEGMPEWKKANEVDELKELFVTNTPPPPPFPVLEQATRVKTDNNNIKSNKNLFLIFYSFIKISKSLYFSNLKSKTQYISVTNVWVTLSPQM